MSDFVDSKRIAYPDKAATFEGNHIKPARWHATDPRQQVVLRGAHQTLPLLPPNARRSATKLPPRPRAHFDEHQRAIAVAHHEVDLSAPACHVARNKTQALALQKHQRTRFESGSDVFGPPVP
jgi:hypothetical protein